MAGLDLLERKRTDHSMSDNRRGEEEGTWFYAQDGDQHGPMNREDLRLLAQAGVLKRGDYVWSPGMDDWGLAADVGGLFDPPARPSPPSPPPVPPPARPEGRTTETRRVVAGICGILFGAFGVHKFILGRTWQGMTMLLVTVLSFFLAYPLMHFLGFVEGMIYLIKDDEEFYRDYIVGRRGWL